MILYTWIIHTYSLKRKWHPAHVIFLTRNPTPQAVPAPGDHDPITWETYTEDNLNYIYIGRDVLETAEDFRQHEYAFWQQYMSWIVLGEDGIILPRNGNFISYGIRVSMLIADRPIVGRWLCWREYILFPLYHCVDLFVHFRVSIAGWWRWC